MVELVARFGDMFKDLHYNRDAVCELFKRLQDMVVSRSSKLQEKLKDRVCSICESEANIVEVLSSHRVGLTPEEELKFYAKAYTLITEAIEDLEGECYYSFRDRMDALSHWCKKKSR